MNKKALAAIVAAMIVTSCVTVPDGELQMAPRMVEDFKGQRETPESLKWGRPMYVEVQAYPILAHSGDIVVRSTVLMNVGREVMSLEDLVDPSVKPRSGEKK